MIRRRSRQVSSLALALVLNATLALAVTPQDYARGRHLRVSGDAAIGAYTLPLEVLTAVEGQLARVAVFNADGNIVPHAFRVPDAVQHARTRHTLPLFPIFAMGGEAAEHPQVEVTTQRDGTLTRVYVSKAPSSRDARPQAIARYLVDATTAPEGSIDELSFVVRPHAGVDADFTWPLHVRAGASLDSLNRVTYSGTLVKLTHQGTSLQVASIQTPGLRDPYLEVSWQGTAPGVIERVEAIQNTRSTSTPLRTTEIAAARLDLTQTSNKQLTRSDSPHFALTYDAGAVLPTKELHLVLKEVNVLASVDVYASAQAPPDAATLGSLVFSGNFYRLSHSGALVTSPPVTLSGNQRFITIVPKQPTSETQLGLTSEQPEKWPRLRLTYAATQVLFLASGQPPFTLSFGSYEPSHASSPEQLLAVNVSNATQLAQDNVTAGDTFVLGSLTAPQEPWPWKRIGLWSVLAVGVAVLALMTRGLLKRVS